MGKVRCDGVGNAVLQRRLDQRHPQAVVVLTLLAAARISAELNGLPKRPLCPIDRGGVDCRGRREVDGLIRLRLHVPSLVGRMAQTACTQSSVSAPMIISSSFSEEHGRSQKVHAIRCGQHYCVEHAVVHA